MTATPSRVFVARLAGIAVFDPAGDQIGRVRDVVVVLRPPPRTPRVLGLVVEVPPHRLVFLPITRVTNIDAGAVIFDGRINMRRFEKRGSETLVLAELLDRTVELTDAGDAAVVVDLAMERTRTRDWLLSKVAVHRLRPANEHRHARGLLRRRRGETIVADWEAVRGFFLAEEPQGADSLLAAFEQMRAPDLANV